VAGDQTGAAWIPADARRILVARGLRGFSDGFLAVSLAVYLGSIGLSSSVIGLILTSLLFGAAALTVLTSVFADRWGS